MTASGQPAHDSTFDPALDLIIERSIDVPPALLWRAWTEPEQLKKWFTPAPWQTVGCEIDLKPGGIFSFTMRSPEGEEFTHTGCYLNVVENTRLVWTLALGPGFRPLPGSSDVPQFTAIISMQAHAAGTRYSARAMHRDAAGCRQHEAMGFHEGWGVGTDQMAAMCKRDLMG
jgi:uncharacterized protein YndB with AHSA1/START domain